MLELIEEFIKSTGIAEFFTSGGWKNLVMILIALLLMYFAIFKQAEPYLLIPISFGVLLVNLPLGGIFERSTDVFYSVEQLATSTNLSLEQARQVFTSLGLDVEQSYQLSKIIELGQSNLDAINALNLNELELKNLVDFLNQETQYSGLLGYLYYGVQTGIYPCLIFLGIGATTDFGPLISNPKSMILGAAAQIGIFITFLGALLLGFTPQEASSIGIIGGADGPTAILVTKTLAPHLLSSISIAAYSYMALVPFIQPPIIRLLTTKKRAFNQNGRTNGSF